MRLALCPPTYLPTHAHTCIHVQVAVRAGGLRDGVGGASGNGPAGRQPLQTLQGLGPSEVSKSWQALLGNMPLFFEEADGEWYIYLSLSLSLYIYINNEPLFFEEGDGEWLASCSLLDL